MVRDSGGELETLAAFIIAPGVGFRVVFERPGLRVPSERALVPICEVEQVGARDGAGSDLDVALGLGTRCDAIEPVLAMIFGAGADGAFGRWWFFDEVIGA